MKRAAIKWITLGAVLAAVIAVVGVVDRTGSRPGSVTLASSTCGGSGFCISSPSTGPVLYPGATASSLPLTFSNPTSVPITVSTLTVTLTNAFPTNCDPSAFQINGIGASGSTPAVTVALPSPVSVPAASGSTPGTSSYTASLALADNGKNQDACKNLALAMSYRASATYTVPTTTTLTSSPNASTWNQPVTLTATVAPNITPSSAGSTPTGTVTFNKCTNSSCSTFTSLGSAPVSSSGVASLTTAFAPVGSYNLYAVYQPTNSTDFSASTSSTITQTVNYTSCITSKVGSLTVSSGQDICIRSTGSVGGNVTVNGGGRVDILGGSISSNLTIQSGGALNFQGGTLSGSLSSTGANFVNVCGATIKGWVTISASTSFVLFGDAGDDGSPGCAGNSVSANLTLSNNTAGLEVGGNTTFAASVSVTGNTGAGPNAEDASPEIEKNKISGNLSCSNNTPAPINDGYPNTVSSNRSGQCSAPGF